MDQLVERLGKLSELQRQASQDQRTAQEMRRRAEELLNQATPEERRRLQELARQLGDEVSEQPPGPTSPPSPTGETMPRPAEQPSVDGASPSHDRALTETRRDHDRRGEGSQGQGRGGARQTPDGAGSPSAPWTSEELVDARGKPDPLGVGPSSQREAGRWSGDKPPPAARLERGASVERARQAAQGFERAIEQQSVPNQFTDLIRRVQRRYAQRGAAPAPGPSAPGRAADAPDAGAGPR